MSYLKGQEKTNQNYREEDKIKQPPRSEEALRDRKVEDKNEASNQHLFLSKLSLVSARHQNFGGKMTKQRLK